MDEARREQVVVDGVEAPSASYAGRTRYTLLEYEAALANASIGIAFTRDRKFFLCNPKFAEIFGWAPNELIGQPGEAVYTSRESYAALGAIAVPTLTRGDQLDLEWEMKRKNGSSFLARMIAKTINPDNPGQGTVWIVEDITGRKRATDELNRLLREQEAILQTASVGISFVKDRRIMRCTRRFEEMFGYESGEMIGEPTLVLYPDENQFQKIGDAYAELARGLTFTQSTLLQRKDGTTFWARITGRAADPTEPLQGSVWLTEDITEQRRADEEIQRLVLEQQALLNNVVVGITIVRDRKILRCNRRFEELFGMASGEGVASTTRSMYFTEEEFERGGQSYAQIDSGGTYSREQWLRRADGSGFWCRMSGRAVEPGEPAKGYVWLFEDISERKRADEDVQRLLKEQNAILENALIGIAFLKDRRIVRCNRRFEEIFGYVQGSLLNQATQALYASPEAREAGDALYDEVWGGGATTGCDLRMKRSDGSEFWCFLSGRAVQSGDPAQGSVWLFEDVTADKSASDRIRQLANEQELILQNATVGIAFVRNRVIQRSNRFLEQMMGHEPGTLVGQSGAVLFADREEWEAADRQAFESTAPGQTFVTEVRFKRRDGSTFFCRNVGRRIDSGGDEQEWIWSFDDVSAERATLDSLERAVAERTAELKAANALLEAEIGERKQAEQRARHLADHDALTGLPNRRILEDRLTQALALSDRNRKYSAVMFIDLDRFKAINDSLGHAMGDELLKQVAQRLVGQLRIGDTVCRIGGDEFVVVLPEIKLGADAAQVAQKIMETLSEPIALDGRDVTVTPSIGVSVFPDDGSDAETLIRNADAAMYHAKEIGRSNFQFFTEQMNLATTHRLTLENDLRRAVLNGELCVHYQPIIELGTGRTVMHEALLRWNHPEKGVLESAQFIQLAEDSGLILKIGEHVLRAACAWANAPETDAGRPVAVNISARQLNDPRLFELVSRMLSEGGYSAQLLELEISESTVMQQTDATLAVLNRLRALGVSLAIDDFGTGFSSLARLKRFPVDKLKIDKSFFADNPESSDHNAIITAIIGLAHAYGLQVVAEGVETEAQKAFLTEAGCDLYQGYLPGRPFPGTSEGAQPPLLAEGENSEEV